MKKKLGFIGAGKMAEALLKGIISQEIFASQQIHISDIKEERLIELKDSYGVQITEDNQELVKESDIVVLAVKPNIITDVLAEVADNFTDKQVIYSIAAGVELESIETRLSSQTAVFRLMPNTPALIGEGAIAYSPGSYCQTEDEELLKEIFTAAGSVTKVKEELMDAVTGLSGSGPAYVYLIIEALIDAGVNVGLAREKARELVLQTLIGATKTVAETGEHPAQLKDMVTSPGGTTIAALESLEDDGLRSALFQAVKTATNKSKQLKGDD